MRKNQIHSQYDDAFITASIDRAFQNSLKMRPSAFYDYARSVSNDVLEMLVRKCENLILDEFDDMLCDDSEFYHHNKSLINKQKTSADKIGFIIANPLESRVRNTLPRFISSYMTLITASLLLNESSECSNRFTSLFTKNYYESRKRCLSLRNDLHRDVLNHLSHYISKHCRQKRLLGLTMKEAQETRDDFDGILGKNRIPEFVIRTYFFPESHSYICHADICYHSLYFKDKHALVFCSLLHNLYTKSTYPFTSDECYALYECAGIKMYKGYPEAATSIVVSELRKCISDYDASDIISIDGERNNGWYLSINNRVRFKWYGMKMNEAFPMMKHDQRSYFKKLPAKYRGYV